MSEHAEPMFLLDGDHVVPTHSAQGPWDPTTAHGGPIAALLCREVERSAPPDGSMRLARLTCDLFRPVPLQPLSVTHEVVRDGRQIRVVDASLWWEGKLVARATGLLVRVGHRIGYDAGLRAAAEGPSIPGPEAEMTAGLVPKVAEGFIRPGIVHAIELKRVVGQHGEGTPAVAWGRLVVPLVDGEQTTPFQSLACIGDFTSGLGSYLDYAAYASPNADLSFHLVRAPVAAWIGLDAATVLGDDGIGQSRARLFDEQGYVGNCLTTLVVSPRR